MRAFDVLDEFLNLGFVVFDILIFTSVYYCFNPSLYIFKNERKKISGSLSVCLVTALLFFFFWWIMGGCLFGLRMMGSS